MKTYTLPTNLQALYNYLTQENLSNLTYIIEDGCFHTTHSDRTMGNKCWEKIVAEFQCSMTYDFSDVSLVRWVFKENGQ